MIEAIKTLYLYLLYLVRPRVETIISKQSNEDKVDYVFDVLRETFIIHFCINLVFYFTELMIFGEAFPHYGDVIVLVVLIVRLVAMIHLIIEYKPSKLKAVEEEMEC